MKKREREEDFKERKREHGGYCGGCSGAWGGCDDPWGKTFSHEFKEPDIKSRSDLLMELEALFGFSTGTRMVINVAPHFGGWASNKDNDWGGSGAGRQ